MSICIIFILYINHYLINDCLQFSILLPCSDVAYNRTNYAYYNNYSKNAKYNGHCVVLIFLLKLHAISFLSISFFL